MYTRGVFAASTATRWPGELRKALSATRSYGRIIVYGAPAKNKNQMSRKFNSTSRCLYKLWSGALLRGMFPAKPVPRKSFNERLTHSYANVMG